MSLWDALSNGLTHMGAYWAGYAAGKTVQKNTVLECKIKEQKKDAELAKSAAYSWADLVKRLCGL